MEVPFGKLDFFLEAVQLSWFPGQAAQSSLSAFTVQGWTPPVCKGRQDFPTPLYQILQAKYRAWWWLREKSKGDSLVIL